MELSRIARCLVPRPVRQKVRLMVMSREKRSNHKLTAEMGFWKRWVTEHGCKPETEYYRKFMMDMGNITELAFFDDKICLDIGCGPQGSMTWLSNARYAIGLDPLVNHYAEFGIQQHSMLYLNARVEEIPLPSEYVDVVFSMNSLDHVDDLYDACREIRRVLRPGGYFIGSLNLEEPQTATEPWTLTEELLREILFDGWEKEFYKVRPKVEATGHFAPYRYFYEDCPEGFETKRGPKALWCRFRTPSIAGAG